MDWITELPEKLQASLNSLLDRVEKHDESYMKAQNASIGQIWVSMALMNRRIEKLEKIVNAQRKALNDMEQDVDLGKHLDQNLKESLKRY